MAPAGRADPLGAAAGDGELSGRQPNDAADLVAG